MFSPNDAIDIWVVERALGQGGMGSVYRCHNRDAKRILAAIKVLDYGLKRSPKARARFVREAEILFSLDHPNIVKVRNVRLDADPPYLEMEFVEGGSLERRILGGAVEPAALVAYLKQLASALDYLHGRGIRHRDIKPSNILVGTDGNVTLVDFGIATEADGSTLSESGQAMGSVAYVPPEWVRLGELDPVRWDIYALGVCAYEALTGQTAFGVPSGGMSTQRFYQVLTAKQGHAPLDPGPNVPFGLRELIREMTRSDHEQRIGSAAEVVQRLAAVDLADVRPGHLFHDAGHQLQGVGGRPDTPRGETIVPDRSGLTAGAESQFPAPAPVPSASMSGGTVARGVGMAAVGLFAFVASAAAVVGLFIYLGGSAEPKPTTAPLAEPAALAAGASETPAAASAPLPSEEPSAPALVAAKPEKPSAGRAEPAKPPQALPATGLTPPPPAGEKAPRSEPALGQPPATPDAPIAVVEAPAVKTAGSVVRNEQLATWLESHPEAQREAAVAAGKADEKYLKGWTGATPPAGKEKSPAVGLHWGMAKQYCSGRGGLAALDAEPLTWKESGSQPWMEYRSDGGKAAWRRDDGVTSDQVSVGQSSAFIGFRCAK